MRTACSSRSSELNCGSVRGRYALNLLRKVTHSLRASLTHPGCGRVLTIYKLILSGGECTCVSIYLSFSFSAVFELVCLFCVEVDQVISESFLTDLSDSPFVVVEIFTPETKLWNFLQAPRE